MRTVQDPYLGAAEVTPSDASGIAQTRAIYIGVSGDLRVDMSDGSTITFTSLSVGFQPIAVKKVHATGTTATGIIAFY